MNDREKVIELLQETAEYFRECQNNASFASKTENHFWELQNAASEATELLKEHELPTELKQKMWNEFYAEEDEYEKKFVGKEEHLNWFTVYRPWLQKGFDIAIDAIADWEGW